MKRAQLILLLAIPALIAFDQATKFLIRRLLSADGFFPVLPFFSLEYVQNRGIAFGMLQGHAGLIIFTSSVIVLILVVAALAIRHDGRFIWPLAFLVAGSVGNLIDRFFFGYVTDFLRFPYWPAFNFADAFIVTGVIMLLRVFMLDPDFNGEKERRQKAGGPGSEGNVG